MKKEIWKYIPDSNNEYIVSNLGNIMSLPKFKNCKNGKYLDNGIMLSQTKNNKGYLYVYVRINGIKKKEYVHRLVAKAFIKNPLNKPYINHKDCNPLNNEMENLEWCTPQENTDYMASLGRNKRTKIWLENLHKSQEKTKKSVVGVEISTGKKIFLDSVNSAKNVGFSPGEIVRCCKSNKRSSKGYRWYYVEEFKNGIVK